MNEDNFENELDDSQYFQIINEKFIIKKAQKIISHQKEMLNLKPRQFSIF